MAKSQTDIRFGRLLKRLSSTFQPDVRRLLRIVIDKVKNFLRLSQLQVGCSLSHKDLILQNTHWNVDIHSIFLR